MKNHTNKHPFGCGQCNLGFKLKQDLIKHCETAHNGIIVLQEGNTVEDNTKDATKIVNVKEEQTETIIQYIFDDENAEQPVGGDQYMVVNISDVSAYDNAHTVIEDSNRLITTQNEDGTTTYMVATENGEEVNQFDGKTVFFLKLPDNNDETT